MNNRDGRFYVYRAPTPAQIQTSMEMECLMACLHLNISIKDFDEMVGGRRWVRSSDSRLIACKADVLAAYRQSRRLSNIQEDIRYAESQPKPK